MQRTTEERLTSLEVEMLYTNTRVMEALTDIKSSLRRVETRLTKVEQDIDELKVGQADVKKIVKTIQQAQLEKL